MPGTLLATGNDASSAVAYCRRPEGRGASKTTLGNAGAAAPTRDARRGAFAPLGRDLDKRPSQRGAPGTLPGRRVEISACKPTSDRPRRSVIGIVESKAQGTAPRRRLACPNPVCTTGSAAHLRLQP